MSKRSGVQEDEADEQMFSKNVDIEDYANSETVEIEGPVDELVDAPASTDSDNVHQGWSQFRRDHTRRQVLASLPRMYTSNWCSISWPLRWLHHDIAYQHAHLLVVPERKRTFQWKLPQPLEASRKSHVFTMTGDRLMSLAIRGLRNARS